MFVSYSVFKWIFTIPLTININSTTRIFAGLYNTIIIYNNIILYHGKQVAVMIDITLWEKI